MAKLRETGAQISDGLLFLPLASQAFRERQLFLEARQYKLSHLLISINLHQAQASVKESRALPPPCLAVLIFRA